MSGVYTSGTKKKSTIYLWHGERQPACIIVKTVKDVSREDISTKVEELLEYSNSLLRRELMIRHLLFKHKFKIWNMTRGGDGMRLKVFYGSEPSITSKDVSCFLVVIMSAKHL